MVGKEAVATLPELPSFASRDTRSDPCTSAATPLCSVYASKERLSSLASRGLGRSVRAEGRKSLSFHMSRLRGKIPVDLNAEMIFS